MAFGNFGSHHYHSATTFYPIRIRKDFHHLFSYSSKVESFFRWVITGAINKNAATIKKASDIGRETKMEKSPRDKISD